MVGLERDGKWVRGVRLAFPVRPYYLRT